MIGDRPALTRGKEARVVRRDRGGIHNNAPAHAADIDLRRGQVEWNALDLGLLGVVGQIDDRDKIRSRLRLTVQDLQHVAAGEILPRLRLQFCSVIVCSVSASGVSVVPAVAVTAKLALLAGDIVVPQRQRRALPRARAADGHGRGQIKAKELSVVQDHKLRLLPNIL